jgi:hypothetical protein
MKILEDLIGKMDDTLDEIEFYGEKAHHFRVTHKQLADTYAKVGEMHVSIYMLLHDRVVELIEDEKKKSPPPPEMLAIWNYEHQRLVKEFSEAKFLIEDYKKSY